MKDEINRAAKVLPKRWAVRIEVERGSMVVMVVSPEGVEYDIDTDSKDISEHIRIATDLACEEAKADQLTQE